METTDLVVERRPLETIAAVELVITMGTGAVTFFREKGVNTNFHVVSGGIDSGRFGPPGNRQTCSSDVILTGRLVPVKRIDIFLQVIKLVAETCPDVRAVIVGDGEQRQQLEEMVRDLGLSRCVSLAGHQSHVERWLRDSKGFVVTSDSEGLSLSMMEAMMCGLPAVVSDVGDLGDLVEDGLNGYLVDKHSPNSSPNALSNCCRTHRSWRRFPGRPVARPCDTRRRGRFGDGTRSSQAMAILQVAVLHEARPRHQEGHDGRCGPHQRRHLKRMQEIPRGAALFTRPGISRVPVWKAGCGGRRKRGL